MVAHPAEPVLIVEDDPGVRELLAIILLEVGLSVAVCSNVPDALTWLEQQRPALIVLDLAFPRMCGEDIAHTARRRFGQTLPILVITGDRYARERTERAETFVFLAKPFDHDDVLRVVRGLVDQETPPGIFVEGTDHPVHDGPASRLDEYPPATPRIGGGE
jgi:DNA-binding response OmpR family regulator